MQGRALMAERDYAGAKTAWDTVRQRDPLDVVALRAAADARIALGEKVARPAAARRRAHAHIRSRSAAGVTAYLRQRARRCRPRRAGKNAASAQSHWTTLLRVANEGLTLAGEGDPGWQTTRLEALAGLGRDGEALEVARVLTARQDATAALWLTRARLAWKLAGEIAHRRGARRPRRRQSPGAKRPDHHPGAAGTAGDPQA